MRRGNNYSLAIRFVLMISVFVLVSAVYVEAANLIVFNNSNPSQTPYFIVNGTSGMVGIGTGMPLNALQVIGTINATSFVGDGSGLTGVGSFNSTYDAKNTSQFIANGNDIYNINSGITNISNVLVVNTTNVVIGGPNSFYTTYATGQAGQMNVNLFGGLRIAGSGATNSFSNSFRMGQIILTNVTGTDVLSIGRFGGFSGSGGRTAIRTFIQDDFAIIVNDTNSVIDDGNKVYLYFNASSKKVGIGTTDPQAALDVRGVGNFSGTVYINNGTDVSTLVGVPYSGATGNVTLGNNNLSVGTSVFNANTNSLGVGVNPLAALDVNSTSAVAALRIKNSSNDLFVVNSTTGQVGVGFNPTFSAASGIKLAVNGLIAGNTFSGTALNLQGGTATLTGNNGVSLQSGALTAGVPGVGRVGIFTSVPNYALEVNNNTRSLNVSGVLFVNGNNISGSLINSVGIGTITPQQTLNVVGSANITSDLIGKDGFNYTAYAYNQTSSGSSGWNSTSTTIYPTDLAVNVGIGTKTPVSPLTIQGGNITFNTTGTGGAGIILYRGANFSGSYDERLDVGITGNNSAITFRLPRPDGTDLSPALTLARGNSGNWQLLGNGNNAGCGAPFYSMRGAETTGFFAAGGRFDLCVSATPKMRLENNGLRSGNWIINQAGIGEVSAGLDVVYNWTSGTSPQGMNITFYMPSVRPMVSLTDLNGTTTAATRKETSYLNLNPGTGRRYNIHIKDSNWSTTGMDLFVIDELGNIGIKNNQTKSGYVLNVNGSTNLNGNTTITDTSAMNFGSGANGNASIYWDGSKLVIAVN